MSFSAIQVTPDVTIAATVISNLMITINDTITTITNLVIGIDLIIDTNQAIDIKWAIDIIVQVIDFLQTFVIMLDTVINMIQGVKVNHIDYNFVTVIIHISYLFEAKYLQHYFIPSNFTTQIFCLLELPTSIAFTASSNHRILVFVDVYDPFHDLEIIMEVSKIVIDSYY